MERKRERRKREPEIFEKEIKKIVIQHGKTQVDDIIGSVRENRSSKRKLVTRDTRVS